MYELVRHPYVLQKLYDEIDALELNNNQHNSDENTIKYPDYDIVAQLPYVNMAISEVLRMYLLANFAVQRCATDDITIQGIDIKKGSTFQADVYSIHYDIVIWCPDYSYSFIPERHQTKCHPMSYLTFGTGPRICVGMRFALMEIKVLFNRNI